MQILVDDLPWPAFATDPDGVVTALNPAAERAFGRRAGERIAMVVEPAAGDTHAAAHAAPAPAGTPGGPIVRFRDPASLADHGASLRALADGGGASECVVERRDGRLLPVLLSVAERRDSGGAVSGYVALAADLTPRRRADDLQRAEYLTALAVVEADTLEDAAPALLRDLGTTLAWDAARIWRRGDGGALRLVGEWVREGGGVPAGSPSAIPAALVERVAATNDPEWIVGRQSGGGEGASTSAALPVAVEGDVEAVVELVAAREREREADLVTLFGRIGGLVGQLIGWERAQSALQRSEANYRSMVQEAVEALFQSTPAGRLLSANPAFARLLGYEAPEQVVAEITDIGRQVYVDPEQRREILRLLERQGSVQDFTVELRRRDGSTLWAAATIRAVTGPDGTIRHLEGRIEDVSEQRRAEVELHQADAALRESEELYRQLADMLPEAVVVHTEGTVRYVNRAAIRLFAFDEREDWEGADLLSRLHPDYRTQAAERIRRSYEEQVPAERQEAVLLRMDGSPFLAETAGVAIRYRGKPAGLALISDITERRRAEQALRESEERYRALYADIPSMYFTVAADGTVLSVNEHGAGQLGYTVGELEGGSVLRVFPPDQQAAAREHLEACLADPGTVHTWELHKVRHDGSLLDVREMARAVRDRQGRPIVLVVCEDITDRKRAEEELFASRQMLRTVLDTIPQRVFWKDRECVYLGANRPFAADARIDVEEVIGRTDYDLSWSAMAETYRADDRRVMETDTPYLGYEEPQVRSDGTVSWLSTSKVPLHDKDGRVIGVLGTYDDITDRKAADAALRDSEERYRRITEAVTDYLFTVRFRGGQAWETVHGAGCVAVTGYTSDEYAADPDLWLRMVVPDDRPAVLAYSARIAAGERVEPLEHRIIHKDGRVRWVRDTIVPQFDVDGTLVSYDGLIEDISERRGLQDQLAQAQKMEAIGRLAGGVAHDFNNLLTSISGYSSLIRDTLAPDDARLADITEIDRAATRGAALTRQLLAFSRRQIVAPAVFDPNRSIAEMAPMLRRLLGEDIALIANPGSTGNVCMDPGQFGQVVLNLAVNARDAMPDGGTLTIGTADAEMDLAQADRSEGASGRWVLVTVTDTGKGMDEATLAQVFEPFFTTKALGKGTGLGLATVYGIVKQAGGYIWASSEPGRGATFSAYFPRIDAPAEEPGEQRAVEAPRGGTETILVVEDDPAVLTFARQVLERSGYTVLWAGTPKAALALARAPHGTIDLLFTDVVMPGMNGRTLAERLGAIVPGIRTVFTSGYTENGIVRDGVLEHDVRYLAKPYSAAELLAAVRAALDSPRD